MNSAREKPPVTFSTDSKIAVVAGANDGAKG